jgi:hypothetical protein
MKPFMLVIFLILTASCQTKQSSSQNASKIKIVSHIDLYPKYPGCPDYYEKSKQLNCLMKKLNTFLHYNLNHQYQKKFNNFKDTLWVKLEIDTIGQTHFIKFVGLQDSLKQKVYAKIFKDITQNIPKMQPAVYHDRPINFEFKIPIINLTTKTHHNDQRGS